MRTIADSAKITPNSNKLQAIVQIFDELKARYTTILTLVVGFDPDLCHHKPCFPAGLVDSTLIMLRLYTLAALCSFLVACTTADPVPDTPVAGDDTLEPPPLVTPQARTIPDNSVYPLLVAEFALRRRAFDVALDHYMAQSRVLRDPAVSAHTTHLAQFMKREPEALAAAQLWVELEPDNLEAHSTLSTLLVRRGRVLEAMPHLAQVTRGGGDAPFPIVLTGFDKMSTTDQETLEERVSQLTEEFPNNTQLMLTQALILAEWNRAEQAMNRLMALFKLEPFHYQALLLEAKLLLERGHKEPFRRIAAALVASPDDSRLRLQYARLLTRDNISAAREQFEILSAQSPEDGDLLFSLALINREMDDSTAAKRLLERLLELEKRENDARYYLGRIAEEDGENLELAVSHYMKVTAGRDFMSANHRLGRILVRTGQSERNNAYLD
ncbi:MAG: tetratricopeptide repeat protein, partial [Halieaceae bacterium]|nr:tetratricopeptide repeat protein [Halieaceae bacterium]